VEAPRPRRNQSVVRSGVRYAAPAAEVPPLPHPGRTTAEATTPAMATLMRNLPTNNIPPGCYCARGPFQNAGPGEC
jgi:hypothetical protein